MFPQHRFNVQIMSF